MKERPILFSGPMVRAILEGRKTQTRRALKHQPLDILPMDADKPGLGWVTLEQREPKPKGKVIRCRFGVPGDRLWVRETWAPTPPDSVGPQPRPTGGYIYRADSLWVGVHWRPSIFMPRLACRIVLEIADIRAERLLAISEDDAQAESAAFMCSQCGNDLDDEEGAEVHAACDLDSDDQAGYRMGFQHIWCGINGAESWDANPLVWAITFRRMQ